MNVTTNTVWRSSWGTFMITIQGIQGHDNDDSFSFYIQLLLGARGLRCIRITQTFLCEGLELSYRSRRFVVECVGRVENLSRPPLGLCKKRQISVEHQTRPASPIASSASSQQDHS